METLPERYERLCRGPNDISEHLPLLFDFASRSRSVVELGVRGGNSTTALLWGLEAGGIRDWRRHQRLDSIDVNACPIFDQLARLAPSVVASFQQIDSRELSPIGCDLLFIDTLHTEAQLAAELSRHASHARKWIILHDTTAFGDVGEDGGAGLWPAVEEFLVASGGRWRIRERLTNQNGLTVLARIG